MLFVLTSGGSIKRSTASDMMKKEMKSRNRPLTKPANTSALTYPYEYLSFARHLVITEAARPANKPVQSKNIWNESEINPTQKPLLLIVPSYIDNQHIIPKLFVHIPYNNSTKANDKLSIKNKNRFREFLSEKMSLIQPWSFSLRREPRPRLVLSLWDSGNIFKVVFSLRLCTLFAIITD